MNALLNIKDNQLNIFLQGCYYSKYCSGFYICLLVFALTLILVTIIMGIQVTRTAAFLVFEFLINFMITFDFALRLKLAGIKKFFLTNVSKPKWWSIFDTFVVITCNIMFIVSVVMRNSVEEDWFEAFEETFFVLWAIWQILRMVMIAKKHRQARQNAKTLINFESIVIDTEFGQMS